MFLLSTLFNRPIFFHSISKPNFFDGLGLKKFLKKDFRKNIQDNKMLKKTLKQIKPDIIFHLAAQSSVLVSYKDPIDTTRTNIMGNNTFETWACGILWIIAMTALPILLIW